MSWLNKLFKGGGSGKAIDYTALKTDMHSHLIPGIDDGAKDLQESLELIEGLYELGYRHLVTTPHVMSDFYPNTRADILRGLGQVQRALEQNKIDIRLDAAAEYYLDEEFSHILDKEELLTLPGGKYVLVEMGFIAEPPRLHDYLFRLQTKGYQPILAHPERYGFYKGNLEKYEELRQHGCLFQLNILSLNGHYGSAVQKTAEKLIKAGMVEFFGTDLHNLGHLEQLEEMTVGKTLLDEVADKLMNDSLYG